MYKFKLIISVLCLFVVITNGCSLPFSKNNSNNSENAAPENQTSESAKNTSEKTIKEQDEIRQIDFKNFTYEPYCASPDDKPEKLSVRKGEYSRDKGDDKIFFKIGDITYGDVNGDGQTDAVILSSCNTGGSGNFSEGFVYTMKNGKPALLTRISGGDRAYGGLRSAKVENGLLLVERNDENDANGSCCPEYSITTKYKWNGKDLTEVGNLPRRELYPKTRISFAKGSSESVSKIRVEDIKRFVVGAGAGQTLTVSVNSKSVALSLLSDDADVSNETNSLTAKLNKNGDYVIELQNLDEKPVEVTLKIEIR